MPAPVGLWGHLPSRRNAAAAGQICFKRIPDGPLRREIAEN